MLKKLWECWPDSCERTLHLQNQFLAGGQSWRGARFSKITFCANTIKTPHQFNETAWKWLPYDEKLSFISPSHCFRTANDRNQATFFQCMVLLEPASVEKTCFRQSIQLLDQPTLRKNWEKREKNSNYWRMFIWVAARKSDSSERIQFLWDHVLVGGRCLKRAALAKNHAANVGMVNVRRAWALERLSN